jgi:hypothetical protein
MIFSCLVHERVNHSPAAALLCTMTLATLLLFCSTGNPGSPHSDFGEIRGSVIDTMGHPVPDLQVRVSRIHSYAATDSGGRFRFFNVPAGEYYITAYNTTDTVSVVAGETTTVDMRIIPRWYGSNKKFQFYPVSIISGSDSGRDIYSGQVLVLDDSVMAVRAWLVEMYTHKGAPDNRAVTVRVNGDSVGSLRAVDGMVECQPIRLTGADTISLSADSSDDFAFSVFNATHQPQQPFLLLSTANLCVPCWQATSEIYHGPRLPVGPESLCIQIPLGVYGPIDWNLYLVNNATNDTCSYANPNPDWDPKDDNGGNPYFVGNDFRVDTLGHSLFGVNAIYGDLLAPGTYTIMVSCYDSPEDKASLPELMIARGPQDESGYIKGVEILHPSRPLVKGDLWVVGVLEMPSMKVDTGAQAITRTADTATAIAMMKRGRRP